MPKTIHSKIKLYFNKISLRSRGVKIYHNTFFSNVDFMGKATIEPYCRLIGDDRIRIGKDFYMNSGCHILGNITIGDNVMIGPKSIIWGRDHGMKKGTPMNMQAHIKEDIVIGSDVWIAANVTILKGVSIGHGAVIGAGAIVIKDIPDNAVVVGNPTRILRYR